MKYKNTLLVLISLIMFLFCSQLSAENKEGSKKGKKGGHDPVARFINMSDEELNKIEAAIQKIRNMSAEEKSALKEKMGKFSKMNPENRKKKIEHMKKFKKIRESMDENEKANFKKEMDSLSPEQKKAKIESLMQQHSEK